MKIIHWIKNGVLAWLLFKPHSRPRRVAKTYLLRLKPIVVRSPRLKKIVFILLKPFPTLSAKLRMAGHTNLTTHHATHYMPDNQQDLSPHAKQIYIQLKQAIEQNKKERV